MNLVFFESLGVDRLKGSEAHVKCQFANLATATPDLLQDFRREVQAGGRGRNGSRPLAKTV